MHITMHQLHLRWGASPLAWFLLLLLLSRLVPPCCGYEYNMTITTTSTSPLEIWYSFTIWQGNDSPWHYHGPFDTTGTQTLYMSTSTQLHDSNNKDHDYWRLMLAAFGDDDPIAHTLTVTDIVATRTSESELDPDWKQYDSHVWQAGEAHWICHTTRTGCCVMRFGLGADKINYEEVSDPCDDLYLFESNREGPHPTKEPTKEPTHTDPPTAEPTNRPSVYPTLSPVDTSDTYCYCRSNLENDNFHELVCSYLPYNKPDICGYLSCEYYCERGTKEPSMQPTQPTVIPSLAPSKQPSTEPTEVPTVEPTPSPTLQDPIYCSGRFSCEGQTLECIGSPCQIHCEGWQSCLNANIWCKGRGCEIYCTGQNSCDGAQVRAISEQVSVPLNYYQTAFKTVYRTYAISLLQCDGVESCHNLDLRASDALLDAWQCKDDSACLSASWQAYKSAKVSVQCSSDHSTPCSLMTAKCTGSGTECRIDTTNSLSNNIGFYCDSNADCECDGDDCDIQIAQIPTAPPTPIPSVAPTLASEATEPCEWTEWYSRDRPSVTGDWEVISAFRRSGNNICNGKDPHYIDCRDKDTHVDYYDYPWEDGVYIDVYCDRTKGFLCQDNDDPAYSECPDFEVRFCCLTTDAPTPRPSRSPSLSPTDATSPPTAFPTTSAPTERPTEAPTPDPTVQPTDQPTDDPTKKPTSPPTAAPSAHPTESPTSYPTIGPTMAPSPAPTAAPSQVPTTAPTPSPTTSPTDVPSVPPTAAPTGATSPPTKRDTLEPSPAPSIAPTTSPTDPSPAPTSEPSRAPSEAPSIAPTHAPSWAPSTAPTEVPSQAPTAVPSDSPTIGPTLSPTIAPSIAPSVAPTSMPTTSPSDTPSRAPSNAPTSIPTSSPTLGPTSPPTGAPSSAPSLAPTSSPTAAPSPPTASPSTAPSHAPTSAPTHRPTEEPTDRFLGWLIVCDEERECANAEILCPHDLCLVECRGVSSCENARMHCFEGKNCMFHCEGENSCAGASFELEPRSNAPLVQCTGSSSCAGASVSVGENAGLTRLECSASSACENLFMRCSATGSTCNAVCSEYDESCSGLSARCQGVGATCFIDSTGTTHTLTPVVTGDSDSQYSCSNCDEIEKNPSETPTQAPTTSPTLAPTHDPTQKPTKVPTTRPTLEPTPEPTNRPTKVPLEGGATYEPSPAPSDAPTRLQTTAPTPRPTSSADVCLGERQCAGQRIECIGEFCYIYCGGRESCMQANIQCKGSCVIYCNGQGSCRNASINVEGSDSSLYLVRCGARDSCSHMTVNSKTSSIDSFICATSDSCTSSHMYCRSGASCDVSCRRDDSCTNMYAQCMDADTNCRIDVDNSVAENPDSTFPNITLACDDYVSSCSCDYGCRFIDGVEAIPSPTADPTKSPVPPTPTSSPTKAPSPSPSLAPSMSPTLPQPTPAPTESPTNVPTPSPTLRPTRDPTPAPVFSEIFVQIEAFGMSASGRELEFVFNTDMRFASSYANLGVVSICKKLFEFLQDTQCYYYYAERKLSVVLGADTNFEVNDVVTFTPGDVMDTSLNNNVTHTWVWPHESIQIGPIPAPKNSSTLLVPEVVLTGSAQLGACTNVWLSSSKSRNLGYKHGIYSWSSVKHPNLNFFNFSKYSDFSDFSDLSDLSDLNGIKTNESSLSIPYNLLQDGEYKFNLKITNFVDNTGETNFSVSVSTGQIFPLVSFSVCPSSWFRSAATPLILKVKTEYDISSLESCLEADDSIDLSLYRQQIDFYRMRTDLDENDANFGNKTLLVAKNEDGRLRMELEHLYEGTYAIEANVSVFDNNNAFVTSITQTCNLQIVYKPLVAVLRGGDRVVNLFETSDVVLDASYSYDPEFSDSDDSDASDASSLNFAWNCVIAATGSDCEFLSGMDASAAILTIPVSVLAADTSYEFEVVVTDNSLGSTRSSSAKSVINTQLIELEGDMDWVSFSIYSPIDVSNVGASVKLPLYGPSELKRSEGYEFTWSLFEFDQEPDLTQFTQSDGMDAIIGDAEDQMDSLLAEGHIKSLDGKSGNTLIFGANSLNQASYYLVRLEVQNSESNEYGEAYALIYVRFAPIIAAFDIYETSTNVFISDASELVALEDEVSVAVDAIDPNINHGGGLIVSGTGESADSFEFRFYYKTPGSDRYNAIKFGFDNFIEGILLPSGNATLRVCVLDMFDAMVCQDKNVLILPYDRTNGYCRLLAKLEQMARNANSDQSFISLIPIIRRELLALQSDGINATETAPCLDEILNGLTLDYILYGVGIDFGANGTGLDTSTLAMDDLLSLLDASSAILRSYESTNLTQSILANMEYIMDGYAPHLDGDATTDEELLAAVEEFFNATFKLLPALLNPEDSEAAEEQSSGVRRLQQQVSRVSVSVSATVSDAICDIVKKSQHVCASYIDAAAEELGTGESFHLTCSTGDLEGSVTNFDPSDTSVVHSGYLAVAFPSGLQAELQAINSDSDGAVDTLIATVYFQNNPYLLGCQYPYSMDEANPVEPVTKTIVDVRTSYSEGISGLSEDNLIVMTFDYDSLDHEALTKWTQQKPAAQAHLPDFACAWYHSANQTWLRDGCTATLTTYVDAAGVERKNISCHSSHLTAFTLVNAEFGGDWWEGIEPLLGVVLSVFVATSLSLLLSAYLRYHDDIPILTNLFVGLFSAMNVLSIGLFDYNFVTAWIEANRDDSNSIDFGGMLGNLPEFVERNKEHSFMGVQHALVGELIQYTLIIWMYSFFVYNWLHICDKALDASRDYLKHIRNVIVGINFLVTLLSCNAALALTIVDESDATQFEKYSGYVSFGLSGVLGMLGLSAVVLLFWLRKHLSTLMLRHQAGRAGYVPVFLFGRLKVTYRFITFWCLAWVAHGVLVLTQYNQWYQIELYGMYALQVLNVACVYLLLHLFKPTRGWLPFCCYKTKLDHDDDAEMMGILPMTDDMLDDAAMMKRAVRNSDMTYGDGSERVQVTRIVVGSNSSTRPSTGNSGASGIQLLGAPVSNESTSSDVSGLATGLLRRDGVTQNSPVRKNSLFRKGSSQMTIKPQQADHEMFNY